MKRRPERKTSNSKGEVFYGRHMYPGVAEYENYRILVPEDTIRNMGPSFAGRPVYAFDHVDEVTQNLDRLRNEADGWVSESFYNPHDGNHWVKFIIVSSRGLDAIRRGHKLSNCYMNMRRGPGGIWNGVRYDHLIKSAEYEHLAIVPNPRYDSIILTPEEFRAYNEEQQSHLRKVANSKSYKGKIMGKKSALSLYKKEKVENSKDLATMSVLLPKSNKERTILECVEAADRAEVERTKGRVANSRDIVRIEDEEVTVGTLVDEVIDLREQLDRLENKRGDDDDELDDAHENEDDDEDDDDDDSVENEDDSDDDDDDRTENSLDDDDPNDTETYEEKPRRRTENSRRKPARKSLNLNRDKGRRSKTRNSDDDDDRGNTSRRRTKNSSRDQRTGDDQKSHDAKERARRARHANSNADSNGGEDDVLETSNVMTERGKTRYG